MKQELKSFGDIELSRKVLHAIADMGFEEPSPIQAGTIPLVLARRLLSVSPRWKRSWRASMKCRRWC